MMISLTKPIPFRLRSDIEWVLYPEGATTHWVASDPVQREFYFLSDLEQRVVRKIDGKTTLQSILQAERREVANGSLSPDSISDLIARLHQNALLLPLERCQSIRIAGKPFGLRRVIQTFSYLFALRIPLINPIFLLRFLSPVGELLFNRSMRWLVSLLAASALIIAILNWHALLLDATSFNSTLRGDRLWMTLCLLAGIKVLHELGHGLACQHFGSRCNELGVQFMFGVPSMYCDVTDSWRLPNRWSRIAVAGGGIYVEMVLATLACFLWVSSDSPMIRGISVQVMIVSSLMTILLNANPLLRYDGYYMLSDLVGIPNLADECRKVWRAAWEKVFLQAGTSRFRSKVRWDIRALGMIAYHVLSSVYRYTLLFTITWLACTWLDRNGLSGLAESVKWVAIGTVCLVMMVSVREAIQKLVRSASLNWYRSIVAVALVGWLGALAMWVPFPTGIVARGYLEPDGFNRIFARRRVVFIDSPEDGQNVKKGDELFTLKATDLDLEMLQTQGEIEVAEARVTHLQQRLVGDPESAQKVIETTQLLTGLKDKLAELQKEESRLAIFADEAGVFLAPSPADDQRNFVSPNVAFKMDLMSKTQGRGSAERGELIGFVGAEDCWVVNAFVREKDLSKISVGGECLVRIDQYPGMTLKGNIQSITPEALSQTPEILKGDSLFASFTRSTTERVPEETTFLVVVSINKIDRKVFTFGLASVRIQTPAQSIVSQILDNFVQPFETLGR